MIGQTLKHYQIESILGAGGMGEVYQAKDTRLGRIVALKLLPQAFAQDADRISRFEREAKLLAALNHPNIAALYGMEEADGRHFLVMELVGGTTLAERLRSGPVPAVEALRIAYQIAEALEAAHEKGIIHRDLKPANVKITPDGKIKVLDFGLAKVMEPSSSGGAPPEGISNSPTLSMMATNAGVILGTAAYMSPEQANGLSVDARSDIFSFGSLLYELLAGRQPFQGKTMSEVLASVLVRDPDWRGMPPNLNRRIIELVRRCLDKEPRRRWQAAGDLRVEIEALIADPAGVTAVPESFAKPKPLWKRAIPIIVAMFVAATIASIVMWNFTPRPSTPFVTRFPVLLPTDQAINPFNLSIAISPDSTKLVYATNDQLYLRRMSEMESRPIQGAGSVGTPIFFSPDGQWIGFWSFAESTLKKIAITGGAPIQICKCGQPLGVSWTGDEIVWSDPGKGIVRVSANGGEPSVLVSLKNGEIAQGPQLLDSGKAVLFTLATEASPPGWDAAQIVVQPLPNGQRKVVVRGGSDARYLPSGHLIYALGANIFAVPFDLKKVETKGGPVPVIEGVMRPLSSGGANLSVSSNGTLAYIPGTAAAASRTVLAFADRTGKLETLPLPPEPYSDPHISPDGKQIAVTRGDRQTSDVWIYELAGGRAPRKLTLDGKSGIPVWAPGGPPRVIFQSGGSTLFWQPADGTGQAEPLTKPEQGAALIPESVDILTKSLAFSVFHPNDSTGGISLLSLDGERKKEQFVEVPQSVQIHAAFSVDGRWLAYMSTEMNGQSQVFVQPHPKTGAKYQVTTGGGRHPLWSPDGKQLFYVHGSKMFAVDIQTVPGFSAGPPSELPITGAMHPTLGLRNYDITPDGKRFLVVLPAQTEAGQRSAAQINVIINWLEELKQRVPVQ